VRISQDTQAASPLVVIATFVLVAVILTAGAYALFFDRPEPSLTVVEQRHGGVLSFNVTYVHGGMDWADVKVRFLDAAGTDQAGFFLTKPTGAISKGDVVQVAPQPNAGTYLFLVIHNGNELSRVTVII
jgi:hypothetical protein